MCTAPGRFYQRVDDGTGMGIGRRIAEHPCLPAHHERANAVFGAVIVDRAIATLGVAFQHAPVFLQVGQRLSQRAGRRDRWQRLVHPCFQRRQRRHAQFLAREQSCLVGGVLEVALDSIQLAGQGDCLVGAPALSVPLRDGCAPCHRSNFFSALSGLWNCFGIVA
jgi:hypothetical protein